jgi:hypothetical protein
MTATAAKYAARFNKSTRILQNDMVSLPEAPGATAGELFASVLVYTETIRNVS